ncbi:OsmC family protein [Actinotalea sp.]|uniref:OsmC family protein n=1 Tax=Actinotalea sp. TaxID=1872145 RepID=UPI002C167F47|nr:OsmC family protein [Actinotalea sp.]HQY32791.1 OsmC family protein [Actinotalea sp.]HRA49697.1 OsmC family protein [Actinotalea sp.]
MTLPLAGPAGPLPPSQAYVRETGPGRFTHEVRTGQHVWTADEPVSVGGDDLGPAPYDMLLAALGACTSMTLRMYATRKGWPVDQVAVRVVRDRVDAPSAADPAVMVRAERLVCEVEVAGDLTDEQRERMRQIAARCPVHRTLEGGVLLETRLVPRAEG